MLKSSSFITNCFLAFSFVFISCGSDVTDWTRLDQAVAARNGDSLLVLAKSNHRLISDQAYRALYNTAYSSDKLIQQVLEKPSDLGFFALEGARLNDANLDELMNSYENLDADFRGGLFKAIGKNANEKAHLWLLKIWKERSSNKNELALATAIGFSTLRFGLPDELRSSWIQRAFELTNENLKRAYLYGAYRSAKPVFTSLQSDVVWKILTESLDATLAKQAVLDEVLSDSQDQELSTQYAMLILAKMKDTRLLHWLSEQDISSWETNMVVDAIRATSMYPVSDFHSVIYTKALHKNSDLVSQVFFETVSDAQKFNASVGEALEDVIKSHSEAYHPNVVSAKLFLSKSFNIQSNWSDSDVLAVLQNHPFSLKQAFELSQLKSSDSNLISIIAQNWTKVRKEARIETVSFFISLLKKQSVQSANLQIPFVKQLIQEKDRGVLIALNELFSDKKFATLFPQKELIQTLQNLDPVADIEVYQTYLTLLAASSDSDSKGLINHLKKISYPPIVKALRDAGITDGVEAIAEPLAVPNRKRLSELGQNPIWTLKTNKGTIRIKLDALRNPVTVWLIDSLSQAGLFNDVPFHRVVGNFVLQGGDFERGDGYGGGKTIIPTEASEFEFDRGAVGMASAGTDTESSQYFIMHQWHPHLNGRYTRFGNVIEGIHVVDNIIRGDWVQTSIVK